MPDDEEVVDETQTGGTPPVPAPPAPAPVRKVMGHGGEIPEERVSEIRESAAIKARRKLLKETYGTDDEDEAKKIHAQMKADAEEARKLREDADKKKLSEMSENERLKTELETERRQRAEEKARLEAERDTARNTLETERQGAVVRGLASRHIAPKFIKTAEVALGEHVEKLSKTQLAAFDEEAINKWFVKYAKENPEFAPPKAPAAKTPEEIEAEKKAAARANPPPRRAPVGAPRHAARPPAPAPRPASGPGTFKGKAIRDLTKTELNEYYKSKGMRKPY